jgi:competence protein ComEC
MRSLVIGFVAGAAVLQHQASLPSAYVLGLLLIFALLVCFFIRREGNRVARIAVFGFAGVMLGFGWSGLFAQHYLARELPHEWEGRDVTVVGTVDSLPYHFDRGVRFNLAVEGVIPGTEPAPALPSKLALSWYTSLSREEAATGIKVEPGERWQLTVRLRRPHGNANPHGFDYEVWLLERNIRATGYVRPDQRAMLKNERLDAFVPSIGNVVERSRGWLREKILSALPEKEYAGVIVALVVGDQRAISQSDWEVFNRTGIGHLVSISGLHITMIAGLFAGLVFSLWRRSFFLPLNLPLLLPAQKAAAAAGAMAALLYVLLAGFGVPAQRTLYMLTVVAIALWSGRISSVSHVLCAALAVVVLIDPWAVLWPGFWLSFGAVGVIMYATVGRTQFHVDGTSSRSSRLRNTLHLAAHTQYAVTLGLVPFTMLLFGQISLVSPLANAVAIPLVSFFVTPLSLIGSMLPAPLAAWVLGAAHHLIEWLAYLLQWLSETPAAVWQAPIPDWWLFVPALVGAIWLLAPRGWPVRWLGIAALLPLFLNVAEHPNKDEMWVTAFDVGQGTAVLVETESKRLLYDTGPAYSEESDGGNRVILPYLKARGIHSLDAVVISHSDADHAGGALSILDEIDVVRLSSSLPPDNPILASSVQHERCHAGQSWTWDGVHFEMLHPSPVSYDSTKWKPNARSCTLRISLGAHSMLLPGDIEASQEAYLVETEPQKLQASVLLAPHHGSGTSSTLPFLQAVQPQIALFQVGYRNRYRHPKAEVYERYGELGIARIRSDESGAVMLRFGEELEVIAYRTDHPRYWYGR